MLKLSRSPVVVAFDKVDCSAGQPLSIGKYAFRSSQAEIPEKIKNIAWLGASVDTFADHIVHLLRIRKRAIAVLNDVEVAEMKIGREPDTAHGFILVDLRAQRHRLPVGVKLLVCLLGTILSLVLLGAASGLVHAGHDWVIRLIVR
jgi:hypothetical protein